MKKVVQCLLVALLIPIYSAGMIGVAVYNCLCSHSGQMVLLAQDDCSCQHQHQCCSGHDYDHANQEHCCSITYQILHLDQEIITQTSTFNSYSTAKALYTSADFIKIPAPNLAVYYDCNPPPLGCLLAPDIYRLAQLRL